MSLDNTPIGTAIASRVRFERLRDRLCEYALGSPRRDDFELVAKLRDMRRLDRVKAVLGDRAFRGAALRAGADACRVHQDVLARALAIAVREAAPMEARALYGLEHSAAVDALALYAPTLEHEAWTV